MSSMSSIASTGLNMALTHEAYKRQNKKVGNEREERIAALQARDAALEKEAQKALRARLAAARARAGGAGIATSGGSIDAVLRGLEREVADKGAARAASSSGQIAGLRDAARDKQRRNLLTMSNKWLDMASGLTGGRGSLLG